MGDQAVRQGSPSSGPSDHLLPQGEKGSGGSSRLETYRGTNSPSPLAGEGGARSASGEGNAARTKKLRGFARHMRRHPTEAERRMWLLLRDRRLSGLKFRRQMPLDSYVVDFASLSARLVVELDGSQHADSERDQVRDAALEALGYEVLRFWNTDVLLRLADVLETIFQHAMQKGAC
ncbi:MAG: DUF559 domain-containing protein [Alphaproteobacteria bacterium]|nr:DUF559 domain-containing protein [Alphaproteobacteria bacterium]